MTASIQNLFDIHCLPALEKQYRLATLLEAEDWRLDLNAGTIIFNNRYVFPVQLVGLESEADRSWLWGWASQDADIAEELLVEANALWEYGERYDIDLLADPRFPLDEFDGHYLALIASGVQRASCYYRCPYRDGAAYVLLSAKIIDKQTGWSPRQFVDALNDLVTKYTFNHRTAFLSFCTWRNWDVDGEAPTFRVYVPSGEVITVRFDRQSQLTEVGVT
jgi:hypothetical protein